MADVTGIQTVSGSAVTPVFVWRHGRPLAIRGSLRDDRAATMNDRGFDLNNYGQVVGNTNDDTPHQCQSSGCIADFGRAVLWEPDGTVLDIGTFGGISSFAMAVNDWPVVVGRASTPNSPVRATQQTKAFYWTWRDGLRDLGTLGGISSGAQDINNRNEVVGWSQIQVGSQPLTVDDPKRAFKWTESTGMRDLGALAGFKHSYAMAINLDGWVAGFVENFGDRRAVLWRPDGTLIELGTLGGAQSWATDINHWGEVAGISQTADGKSRIFVWRQDTGMIGLDPMGQDQAWHSPFVNEGNPRINSWGDVIGVMMAPGFSNPKSFVWVWAENRHRYGF